MLWARSEWLCTRSSLLQFLHCFLPCLILFLPPYSIVSELDPPTENVEGRLTTLCSRLARDIPVRGAGYEPSVHQESQISHRFIGHHRPPHPSPITKTERRLNQVLRACRCTNRMRTGWCLFFRKIHNIGIHNLAVFRRRLTCDWCIKSRGQ